jgi:hypothetical protein
VASSLFITTTPSEAATQTYAGNLSETRKREMQRRYLSEKRDQIHLEVIELEGKLGIDRRWSPTSPEYVDALRYSTMQAYHNALDKLQKLVIQRLFELHKLNLNFTGVSQQSM